jgi:LysR family transcriptional activator of mexEF-oprN operon
MKPLDVHMLACLEALVNETHVSRAAARVGIGQPSMSAVLARLRKVFGDPLLVRTPHGMAATPRAQQAASQVREALKLIQSAVSGQEGFEPGRASSDFRVVAHSSLAFTLLPNLVRQLATKAPGIRVLLHPEDVRMTRKLLEEDLCDMVVGYPPKVAQGLHAQSLSRLRIACIARKGHPSIRGEVTLDDYLRIPHVVVGTGTSPVSTIESNIERALRQRRRKRTVGVLTPDVFVSSAVVAGTDMIATVSERIARELSRMLPLQVLKVPIPVADPNILMIWHERSHKSPGHRFLRQLVRDASKELQGL